MKLEITSIEENVLQNCNQLLVVTASKWSSDQGRLYMYEKNTNDNWEVVNSSFPVSLGKNGMVWGDGIIKYSPQSEHKKEGDNKTPAGIYTIDFVFGYAPPGEAQFIKLPYLMSNKLLKCVDDPGSKHYNRIVSTDIVEDIDWNSAEEMRRDDDLYKWGIVMDFNFKDPEPGRGSCVFIHLWRNAGSPTDGCTAMSEENMLKLLKWLDPDKDPLIAQFPEEIYTDVREKLGLPALGK